jgi:hypothetical protein
LYLEREYRIVIRGLTVTTINVELLRSTEAGKERASLDDIITYRVVKNEK